MVAIEIAMLEPKTQFGGVHVILDFDGLSINHVGQFSPVLAKVILDWVQVRTLLYTIQREILQTNNRL